MNDSTSLCNTFFKHYIALSCERKLEHYDLVTYLEELADEGALWKGGAYALVLAPVRIFWFPRDDTQPYGAGQGHRVVEQDRLLLFMTGKIEN